MTTAEQIIRSIQKPSWTSSPAASLRLAGCEQ